MTVGDDHLAALEEASCQLAGLRMQGAALALALTLRAFNADQPRVPAGSPDGGQWTSGGDAGGARVEPAEFVDMFGRLPPLLEDLLRLGRITEADLTKPKEAVPKLSGKEAASNPPDWARGNKPMIKESGKDFAKRLMDEKYGPGKYETGPRTEFSRIQKWGDRHFRIPRSFYDDGGT